MKPSGRAAVSYTSAVVSPQEAVPMPSLAACLLAVALAAPPKPVAHLRVATKDVKVFHGANPVPAAKDLPLELADEVDVPVGGFALVEIDRNKQLVRIDEDLRLAVRDLAALEAPQATASFKDQVNALLTSTENTPAGAQRMVGWVVSPAAAQVQTNAGFAKAMDDEEPAPKVLERQKRSLSGPPTKPARGGGASAPSPRQENLASNESVPEPRANQPLPPPPPASAPPAPEPQPSAKPAPPMSPAPGPQLPDAATRACLREALRRLGEPAFRRIGPTVTVKLRRGDHRVVVFLEGAVPVDGCVQRWADQQAELLPDQGWAVLEVPLR